MSVPTSFQADRTQPAAGNGPGAAALARGDVFAELEIESEIGRGGMGVVYRARDPTLERTRALKVLPLEHAADPGFRERFRRESRLAARVEHPNVATIYRAGEENGRLYLVMRLIDGGSLEELLATKGRLDPARAAELIAQIAAALDAAHERGLIHRDVKPANVLIEGEEGSEQAFLCDFGITKLAEAATELTATGEFIGTVDYVAPEQIAGDSIDARTDVYSLACLAYHLLAGTPPFARRLKLATLFAHANAPRPRLSERMPGLRPALDRVLARGMAKRPAERHPSAGELAAAIADALGGQTPEPVPPRGESHAEPPLLEREPEIAILESALADAAEGAGRLLVVHGTAGIGKTRLLGEARAIAERLGIRALAARGTELEREFPFALARQLFEPALAGLDPTAQDELLAGAAAPAGPAIGIGEAADSADAGGFADPTFAILNGLYWLVSNLAENGPLLLAVDDAHWSDPASLRLFRFLAARLSDLPVLLVLAARPAEPGARPPLLGELLADPTTTVVNPRELSPAAVAELVRAELDTAEDEFCAACHEASGGNPFLLKELLVDLAAAGRHGTAADAVTVRETAPETIRRGVLLRLGRLPDPATALARAVAVLGDEVALPDAAELAGVEREAANEAADALAAAAILAPTHPLSFVHPITRTAVYAEIAPGTRASAHERTAEILAARGADPERIAVHLLATDPRGGEERVRTLHAAARRALERGAPETAASYLRRALDEPAGGDVRLDLVRLLLVAHFRGRGDRRGFDDLIESTAYEELTADPRSLLNSAAEVAFIVANWGRFGEAEQLLERAIAAAIEAGNRDLVARFQALIALIRHRPPAEVLARLERYRHYVEPDTPTERLYLALEAQMGLHAGTPRETAIELARGAVAGGRIWRENLDIGVVFTVIWALRQAGDLDGAERALEQQAEAVGSRGTWAMATAGWDRGELALLRGRVVEAEAEARASVEACRHPAYATGFHLSLALLVEVLVERDDLSAAEAELAAAGLTEAVPEDWWYCMPVYSRGRLRLAEGRPGEALEDFAQLGRIAADAGIGSTGYRLPAASHAALALNEVGNRDAARAVAEEELASARAWGLAYRIGIALRTLGLIEGGQHGLELLRESIEVLEPSPYRLEHARSLVEYGAALRRADRSPKAREPLRAALEWARKTGALAVARLAHAELEAMGEKPAPLAAEGVESLTPSERRVCDLAAAGKTNREIAQRLFVSARTVETHLSHAYRKLEIGSRHELAAALTRRMTR